MLVFLNTALLSVHSLQDNPRHGGAFLDWWYIDVSLLVCFLSLTILYVVVFPACFLFPSSNWLCINYDSFSNVFFCVTPSHAPLQEKLKLSSQLFLTIELEVDKATNNFFFTIKQAQTQYKNGRYKARDKWGLTPNHVYKIKTITIKTKFKQKITQKQRVPPRANQGTLHILVARLPREIQIGTSLFFILSSQHVLTRSIHTDRLHYIHPPFIKNPRGAALSSLPSLTFSSVPWKQSVKSWPMKSTF